MFFKANFNYIRLPKSVYLTYKIILKIIKELVIYIWIAHRLYMVSSLLTNQRQVWQISLHPNLEERKTAVTTHKV